MSSSPSAAGNKHCVQFIQCFSLSKRILKQGALEALAPPPQCSHSVGEQSGSSEAVGLCMLRVKYDLKSGLKFVQETRIFIAPDDEEIQGESDEQQQRGAGQGCLRLSWHRGLGSGPAPPAEKSHHSPWEALARLSSPGLVGCPKLPAWTAETQGPCWIHCCTLFPFSLTENYKFCSCWWCFSYLFAGK